MAVQQYLTGDSSQVLVVHGESGVGKTSFMAKVASSVHQWVSGLASGIKTALVPRFVGVTPNCSSIQQLLYSVCHQVGAGGITGAGAGAGAGTGIGTRTDRTVILSLSVCLSVSVSVSVYVSVSLAISLSVSLRLFLAVYICLFVCLRLCPSAFSCLSVSVCLCLYLSVCQPVCLCLFLAVYTFLSLSLSLALSLCVCGPEGGGGGGGGGELGVGREGGGVRGALAYVRARIFTNVSLPPSVSVLLNTYLHFTPVYLYRCAW